MKVIACNYLSAKVTFQVNFWHCNVLENYEIDAIFKRDILCDVGINRINRNETFDWFDRLYLAFLDK